MNGEKKKKKPSKKLKDYGKLDESEERKTKKVERERISKERLEELNIGRELQEESCRKRDDTH